MARYLLLLLFSLSAVGNAQGQLEERYSLPRRAMPLEKVLIKLTEQGAPISYRPDQLPKLILQLPGGRRPLADWLTLLLEDTELNFKTGPAGVLILPDPDLFKREFSTYGLITNAESGERLIGATILDVETGAGTLANEYGYYALQTKGGQKRLRITYTGFKPETVTLVLRKDQPLNISLTPDNELPPVEVTASRMTDDALHLTNTESSIGYREANLFNGPGGEMDILNIAQMLPGVTTGADGVGGLAIRGSNAGHNLVLLDGVPVYNLSHAAGLFSIFNSAAIRRADVYKEGVPARFGGRIGGVLDVHTRDGNLYQHEFTTGTSLLAANFTAEGPLKEGESSYLLSGRYFWGGDILRSLSQRVKASFGREGAVDYGVNDFNFKLNQRVGKRGRLYLSAYRGADEYANSATIKDSVVVLSEGGAVLRFESDRERSEAVDWGNTVAALRYNYLFSDRFFGNFRFSYSDLLVRASFERSDSLFERTRESLSTDISSGRFGSDIQQFGAAFDGQLLLADNHQLRFGTSMDLHRFLPQLRSDRIPLRGHPELKSLGRANRLRSVGGAAYLTLAGRKKWLHYRFGLRGQLWHNRQSFYYLSPRLVLAGRLNKVTSWRATYERLVQPIHLVSSTIIGLPTDLWVPATETTLPSTARQVSLRFDRNLGKGWRFDLTGYYRDLRNLVEYTEGGRDNRWRDQLSIGSGFASGIEATLSLHSERLRGWLSYTLAESRRQFDERVNRGRPFPFRYDRRHGIKLLATYQLSPACQLSGTWHYASGSFYSISETSFLLADPTVVDGNGGTEIDLVGSKNGFQLPANHRLDVTAQFDLSHKQTERRFFHTLNVGVYNLYGRRNPIFYDIRTRLFARGSDLVKQRDFVQIFLGTIQPTLSYSLRIQGQ